MTAIATLVSKWLLKYQAIGIPKRVTNLTLLVFVMFLLLGATMLLYAGEDAVSLLSGGWGSTLRDDYLLEPSLPKKYIAESVLLDELHSFSYVVSTSYQRKQLDVSHVLHKLLSTEKLPKSYAPFIEETRQSIGNHDWVNSHWFHNQVSRVWFEKEQMYFVVHQLLYKRGSSEMVDRKSQPPALSILYAMFESLNLEPLADITWSGQNYPTFIPIDVVEIKGKSEPAPEGSKLSRRESAKDADNEVEKVRSVGPLNPKVIPFVTDEGLVHPLLVFSLETSEGSKVHWMTTGATRKWTKPKAFKLNNVENAKYESWAPFVDTTGSLDTLQDDSVYFVYTAGTNAIIKCQLWNSECTMVDKEAAKDAKGVTEYSNGSPLYSIHSLLKLTEEVIEDVWIGFIDINLSNCGCGQKTVRPALVVYIKEKNKSVRIVQLSQALDLLVPISGWDHLERPKEACLRVSSMRISSITFKGANLKVQVTTSDAINFDVTIFNLISEISKGFSFAEKYTPPNIKLSLERSQSYCQSYGRKHSSILSYFYDDDGQTSSSETEDTDINDTSYVDEENSNSDTSEIIAKGKKMVLYPSYIGNPMEHYLKYFGVFDDNKKVMIQMSNANIKYPNEFTDYRYKSLKLSLYSAFVDLYSKPSRKTCTRIREDIPIHVSDGEEMNTPASKIISKYIHDDPDMDAEQLAYFHEYDEFLKDDIEKMKESDDKIDEHWFSFAGASIFLEEYGIYFVTKRIVYSKSKLRDKPNFSLTYVEVYDRNWEELNAEMVVPATDDDALGFRKFSYPGFIRIASYNNANVNSIKNYGPEDPRVLIRKNHLGHDEPLIVFNQKQRDVVNNDGEKVNLKEHRSFFMCLPWEIQEGKSDVDPLSFKATRTTYTRTIELSIFDDKTQEFVEKRNTEKNWTPFFSIKERQKNNGIDKYVYFVYLFEYVQVLKCEIPSVSRVGGSVCKSVFWNEPTDDHNVYLRGGTQLISLQSVVEEMPQGYEEIQHEVWLGFGRSHLGGCGCGLAMYRPQLVVLAKDFTEDKFQLTHVSSFTDFGLEVVPWGDSLCSSGPNVFLPNGIANWHYQVMNDRIDDVMTLFYSMADKTVGRILIRGLIDQLYNMGAFKLTGEAETLDNKGTTDFFKVVSQVQCASHQSWDFCSDYGKQHKKQLKRLVIE